YQFTPDWQGYVTGFWTKTETDYSIQPVPISDQFFYGPQSNIPAAVLLPPTSPYYPHAAAQTAGVDGLPLNARYRCNPCGNRMWSDENEGWQVVAGVKGTWKDWDFDFNYN